MIFTRCCVPLFGAWLRNSTWSQLSCAHKDRCPWVSGIIHPPILWGRVGRKMKQDGRQKQGCDGAGCSGEAWRLRVGPQFPVLSRPNLSRWGWQADELGPPANTATAILGVTVSCKTQHIYLYPNASGRSPSDEVNCRLEKIWSGEWTMP